MSAFSKPHPQDLLKRDERLRLVENLTQGTVGDAQQFDLGDCFLNITREADAVFDPFRIDIVPKTAVGRTVEAYVGFDGDLLGERPIDELIQRANVSNKCETFTLTPERRLEICGSFFNSNRSNDVETVRIKVEGDVVKLSRIPNNSSFSYIFGLDNSTHPKKLWSIDITGNFTDEGLKRREGDRVLSLLDPSHLVRA